MSIFVITRKFLFHYFFLDILTLLIFKILLLLKMCIFARSFDLNIFYQLYPFIELFCELNAYPVIHSMQSYVEVMEEQEFVILLIFCFHFSKIIFAYDFNTFLEKHYQGNCKIGPITSKLVINIQKNNCVPTFLKPHYTKTYTF